MKEEQKNFIIGRHPAMAALKKKDSNINKVFVQEGLKADAIQEIYTLAKARKLVVSRVPKTKLDNLVNGQNHQGVVIAIASYSYATIDDLFEKARSKNEDPFFLILDGIEDPHNLGSIIRTAETAGVHGIIIPKRRAAAVNSTVAKTSAGAVEYMKIARVTNISDAIDKLKRAGLWICGTDISTEKYYYNQDLTGPIGIVIGNEGNGMSEKVRKNCDFLVKIPMKGKVTSLNASV